MPSNYKKILKQQSWSVVGMLKAIDAVKYFIYFILFFTKKQ